MCDPRHQGGEGVAGTPGACSQVFCHPIRCMRCAFISTETCSLHEARTTTTTTTTILKSAPFCLRHLSMDLSWQPVTGAAQRRKGRRLRAAWRHEQQSIAQALAVFSHHSAPRRQETARAGGGARVEVHGAVPGDAPPPGGWRAILLHGRRRGSASRRAASTIGRGAAADGVQAALWQRLRARSRCHSAADGS